MAPEANLARLMDSWLTSTPGSPLITYYGPDPIRVELSGATTANAVRKACNVFRDELLLDPGDVVWFDLPCHWQAPALMIAAWAAGLTVAVGDRPAAADATVAAQPGRTTPSGIALAVSLDPMGMPLGTSTPAGWEDFGALARVAPDEAHLAWPAAAQPWLLAPDPWPAEALLAAGRRLAERWQLGPGAALISPLPPDDPTGVLAAATVPPLVAGRVVLVGDGAPDVAQVSQQEGTGRIAVRV